MTTTAGSSRGRDHRVDFFRGVALAMIFVNHVPGNLWENFTTRNFGFSDSAELFVFLAGYSSAFAYGAAFLSGHPLVATLKSWRRAGTLYLAHAALTLFAVGLFAWAALAFGDGRFTEMNDMKPVFAQPLDALFGLATMMHQLKFVNILPMYIVLLAALPLQLWLVRRFNRHWMLSGSAVLWAIAANTWLNVPNHPYSGGWFFNPFAWQFIFAIGLWCGLATRDGEVAVPYSPRLYRSALAYLLFAMVFVNFELWGWERSTGLPAMLAGFDKTYVSVPRLLHLLALVYVFAHAPRSSCFSRVSRDNPLTRLGRHSLSVFASGTVLALVLHVAMIDDASPPLRDTVLIAAGLGFQFALARFLDWWRVAQRMETAPPAATVAPSVGAKLGTAAKRPKPAIAAAQPAKG